MHNPERWRARAEELRTIAEAMSHDEPRAMMERIAQDYDTLAGGAKRTCDSCGREFLDGETPIAMWASDGWSLQICDACADDMENERDV